jgi:hypothetical protein
MKHLGFLDPKTQILRSLWSLRMTYWTGVGVVLILLRSHSAKGSSRTSSIDMGVTRASTAVITTPCLRACW